MGKKKNDVIVKIISNLYDKNMPVEDVWCLLLDFCHKNFLCKKELQDILERVVIKDNQRKADLQAQLKEILQQ